jgi:hypothetical protein
LWTHFVDTPYIPILASRDSFIFSPSHMVGENTLQYWEFQGFIWVHIHQIISHESIQGNCNLQLFVHDARGRRLHSFSAGIALGINWALF